MRAICCRFYLHWNISTSGAYVKGELNVIDHQPPSAGEYSAYRRARYRETLCSAGYLAASGQSALILARF